MAMNEALAERTKKTRDFQSILNDVQNYITNKYAVLVTNSGEEKQDLLKSFMTKYIEDQNLAADGMTTIELVEQLYSEMAQFSFLTKYLYQSDVEEININSWEDVKITYSNGEILPAEGEFYNPTHAVDVIKRLLRQSKIVFDESKPLVRGHLNNKIRITAYMTPIVDETVGISASIRIVNPQKLGKKEFLYYNTATEEMLNFLEEAFRYGISICCTGATSSGKTTLMSYFLEKLPDNKRIFTAENGTREFDLVKRNTQGKVINNVIQTVTRDSEDIRQCIDSEKLLEFALTTNPDYICVAEMKGPESFAAQEAARTGHAVITTTHANGCEATYARMVTLCKMKYDMKDETLYQLVTEAFPIVVFCKKLEDNSRKIMEITECVIQKDGSRKIQTLWQYYIHTTKIEENGKVKVKGEFKKVHSISKDLLKRLQENGMPEELRKRYAEKGEG